MSFTEPQSGPRLNLRSWIAAALSAGLILRLWFIWRLSSISQDTLVYGSLAQNLLTHHIYGLTDAATGSIHPSLIRLPGYPLFLAVCFSVLGAAHYRAVMLVQVALDLVTCLLLAATARRIFGSRAGLAALWLGCLCPFLANYAAAPLTETPSLFCMALAFYSFARWQIRAGLNRWLLPLGFALAWAILLRPEQGLLAAAIVSAMLYLSWRTSANVATRLKPVLALCVLTVLPLVAWTARNWHTFRVIQPLAPRYANDPGEFNPYGFQRWYRTWAIDFASTEQVYWKFDGEPINIADLPARAFDSPAQRAQTAALFDDYNESSSATPEFDARFTALADQRVHASPLRYYLELPIARVLNMILRPRLDNLPAPLDWWNFSTHPGWSAFATAYALLNLVYLVLAGLALRRRAWNPQFTPLVFAMVATILLRTLLLLNLDNSEPRYTLEFYPVLIILAGGTLAYTLRRSHAIARRDGTGQSRSSRVP